jgi:hypothetical protein
VWAFVYSGAHIGTCVWTIGLLCICIYCCVHVITVDLVKGSEHGKMSKRLGCTLFLANYCQLGDSNIL